MLVRSQLLRKLILSSVIVVFNKRSPKQVAVAVLVCAYSHLAHGVIKPFTGPGGDRKAYFLQHMLLGCTFLLFFFGLVIKMEGVFSDSGVAAKDLPVVQSLAYTLIIACLVTLVTTALTGGTEMRKLVLAYTHKRDRRFFRGTLRMDDLSWFEQWFLRLRGLTAADLAARHVERIRGKSKDTGPSTPAGMAHIGWSLNPLSPVNTKATAPVAPPEIELTAVAASTATAGAVQHRVAVAARHAAPEAVLRGSGRGRARRRGRGRGRGHGAGDRGGIPAGQAAASSTDA